MADDTKAEQVVDQLRQSFATQIREAVRDLPAYQALQLADALCAVQMEQLAGMRVTYRALAKVDADAITEAWRRGATLGEITADFRISRATAYRYHPNKSVKRAKAG